MWTTFIIENPIVQAEEAKQPEKVEFMWDDYHRQQLAEVEDEAEDDWDEDWGPKTTKKALSSSTSVNFRAGWRRDCVLSGQEYQRAANAARFVMCAVGRIRASAIRQHHRQLF